MTSKIPVQPTAALDLTYVLCEFCAQDKLSSFLAHQSRPDNENSTLSLIMALFTLTPILLNVRPTFSHPTSGRCICCRLYSLRMPL